MSKKIIIAAYLLITALILNSVIVFASSGNDTYIKVLKTNPVNNQTNIKIDNIITLKFSGKILKGKEYNKISLKTAKKSIKITSSISSDTLTVKSKSKMDYDTKYTLSIPVGSIKDPSGKSLAKNYILLFTTCIKPVTPANNELNNVKMISVGYENSAVVKNDGTVWMRGKNYCGQLGDGTNVAKTKPVQVKGISNAEMISLGSFCTSVLKKDGTVWTWGANGFGEKKYKPLQIKGLTNVKMLSAGVYSTAALKNDGTVWVWEGLGTNEAKDTGGCFSTPKRVYGLDNVKSISSGDYFISALKNDGTVWEWGGNECGQLGDGTTEDKVIPVQVKGISDIKMISAGSSYMLALKNDGTVWSWGENIYGDDEYINTPTKVAGIDSVKVIDAGNFFSVALKDDGTVWAWGYNDFGVFGNSYPPAITMPLKISDMKNIKDISAGTFHYTFLKMNGTIQEFGWDYSYDIG